MSFDDFNSESTEFDPELYATIYEENICVLPGTEAILKLEDDANNPIKGAFMGGDGKRPELVIAVVRPQHLKTGCARRYTEYERQLAAEIRNRGGNRDQCGHVISFNLGGQMEYKNLFPQGKTSNLHQYQRMEKMIAKFVGSTNRTKPWALILVRLFYNNKDYPNRPTKVSYSFFLYEEKEGNSAANSTDSPILIPILPMGIKISVEGCVYVENKQRVSHNTVKAKSNAEKRQLWEGLAIGFQAAASVVSLLGTTNSITSTSNSTPVPVPGPLPLSPLIKPDVPIQIWSQQILLNRSNLSKPLLIAFS